MKNFLLIICIVIVITENVYSKGLPSYLKICKRSTNNEISQCLKENIEILRPKFKKGIPELFIPSMDPLILPKAVLNSENNFEASFTKIKIYNMDQFQLKNLNITLNDEISAHIDLAVLFPFVQVNADYNVKGRLLVLNVDGSGPAYGNYTNIEGLFSMVGKPFQKNNKQFIAWKKEKIDFKIEKVHLLFDRIFGDNAQLNDQTNRALNENINSIIEDLKPVVREIIGEFIFNIIDRIFERYSTDELFPK